MTQIGVIGLGVMGKNLILNIADHGYKVHVFNRTLSKVHEIQRQSDKVVGYDSLEAFVDSLETPKKILLMVTAGNAVDEYLSRLELLLTDRDIVIDGGNSDYRDTISRSASVKFRFVGAGISGGEYGARNGPSMMVGCTEDTYACIRNILEDISAKHKNKPCCGWMGTDGAGHFVKIVHNGIEYCEMQLLQEIRNLCKTHESVDEIFAILEGGRSSGYLVEICRRIIRKKNECGYVVDQIVDKAEQKGTGKMCIQAAMAADADVSFIATSVFARYLSSAKTKREDFSRSINRKEHCNGVLDSSVLEKAFFLAKIVCYVQGFDLLEAHRRISHWECTVTKVCDVWRNGCILRTVLLDVLKEMSQNGRIETSLYFKEILDECKPALQELCAYAVNNSVYCPLFASCLMWLNGMNMPTCNGTLLQAMRDYFGKHGVDLGTGEFVNVDWDHQLD